jgi:hypothetical protein
MDGPEFPLNIALLAGHYFAIIIDRYRGAHTAFYRVLLGSL